MKENKRVAMRFDKLDSTFLSFIALALAKLYTIWLTVQYLAMLL